MSVKVRIPTPLRKLTNQQAEVDAAGETIRDIVDDLEKQFPGFKERMCDEQGDLRKFVNVYVGEEDIRFMEGLDTKIPEGEQVSIIPAVAGGGVPDLTGSPGPVPSSSQAVAFGLT